MIWAAFSLVLALIDLVLDIAKVAIVNASDRRFLVHLRRWSGLFSALFGLPPATPPSPAEIEWALVASEGRAHWREAPTR